MQHTKGQNLMRPNAEGQLMLENCSTNLKNLYRTENTLSGAWFCELLSDWSKTPFGSQDIVIGHKTKKFRIYPHSNARPIR